ncbi:hypothetical protein [Devosia sp. Root635]|uniref:hypothetical protein n=1 Tax=Devosia sp. Root635 TaxID=1736575 RepID=UPI0006FFF4E1|nr:hypothetical protein [Devosia sp. Root635]KRA42149.1 hypothetical protein ASD80_10525 [Devosia sp. Root635]
MARAIGANASIANPQLKFFERIVGEWRTVGTHPAMPGVTLRGRVSFAWQDGGAFLIWRSEVEHPLFPDGIAIIGSDAAAGTLFISYFDERGVSRKYDVTLHEHGFAMQRLDPKFSQRMTFSLEAGDARMVSKGEMSREGAAWEPDLSQTFERL